MTKVKPGNKPMSSLLEDPATRPRVLRIMRNRGHGEAADHYERLYATKDDAAPAPSPRAKFFGEDDVYAS